jgi:hypothetical protein
MLDMRCTQDVKIFQLQRAFKLEYTRGRKAIENTLSGVREQADIFTLGSPRLTFLPEGSDQYGHSVAYQLE